jgi:hypothetical protein
MYSDDEFPFGPQVTPTHANSFDVGLGDGSSAKVCGTEIAVTGALAPETGPVSIVPLQLPSGCEK